METTRFDLGEALRQVSVATKRDNRLPILGYVFFDGQKAMAYNDELYASAPFKTDFQGGVDLNTLYRWLDGQGLIVEGEPPVKMEVQNGELVVQCRKSKLRLALEDLEAFAYTEPTERLRSITGPADLLKALEGAIPCLPSSTTTCPFWQLGVRVWFNPATPKLGVYAVSNTKIAYIDDVAFGFDFDVAEYSQGPPVVRLPAPFVKAVVDRRVEVVDLQIGESYIVANMSDRSQVASRLLEEDGTESLDNVLKVIDDTNKEDSWSVEITDELIQAVTRVEKVMCLAVKEPTDRLLHIKLEPKCVRLWAKAGRVEITEPVSTIEEHFDDVDFVCQVQVEEFLRLLEESIGLVVSKNSFMFVTEDCMTYLLAAANRE